MYDFDDMVVTFELTLYTPYMLKISPLIRQATDKYPYWPQCATRIEIYGSEGLMYLGRHGGGWQVFGRPELQQGVREGPAQGAVSRSGAQGEFLPVHALARRRPTPTSKRATAACCGHTMRQSATGWAARNCVSIATTEQIVDNPEAMKYLRTRIPQAYEIEENV